MLLFQQRGYNSSSSVVLQHLTAGATALAGERYNTTVDVTANTTDTAGAYGLGKAGDQYTLTVGDDSVTATFNADITTLRLLLMLGMLIGSLDSAVTLSQNRYFSHLILIL